MAMDSIFIVADHGHESLTSPGRYQPRLPWNSSTLGRRAQVGSVIRKHLDTDIIRTHPLRMYETGTAGETDDDYS